MSSLRRACRAVVVCAALMGGAACDARDGVTVTELTFTGVHAVAVSELKQVIATRATGALPWSTPRTFSQADFNADLDRIHAFYADRGYPHERLAKVDVVMNRARTSVRLRVDIDEGAPLIVDSVRFDGFDPLPADIRGLLDQAPPHPEAPRNRDDVRATRDLGARLYRDHGYPLVRVDATEAPAGTPDRVVVTFHADPGPALRFGEIAIAGLQHVDESAVRRMLGFRTGDSYRESRVLATQRRLSALELFDLAAVAPRLDAVEGDRVPMRVTIVEGKPHRLNFGVGYGTEDRARGSVNWQHLNFHGGARQATLDGRLSFLTRSLQASLLQPYVGRPGLSLTLSGIAEKTQQLTYDSQTFGGRATFAYHVEVGGRLPGLPVRYSARVAYANEYLRYGIRPEVLADQSQRAERIALGLDPDTGRGAGRLASATLDVQRAAVDEPSQPLHGTIVSLHLEHAAPWLLGTYRYDEVRIDGREFTTAGPVALAARIGYGTVSGGDPSKVPFSKRYFLGGATSLRGWGRFQVSPLDDAGLPIGGRSLFATSVEARIPARTRLAAAVFVDAGNVWARAWSVGRFDLRTDAGAGLRYRTAIGALSVDLGYQLTPIAGLVVNGGPQSRRWRLHLNFGQSF